MMLTDVYSPRVGGIERYVHSLSLELVKRGHKVIICTPEYQGEPEYKEENGLKVYHIPALFLKVPFLHPNSEKLHPPLADPILSNRLKSIIKNESPDIIHAHGQIVFSLIPLLRNFDVPLVLTLHLYWAVCLMPQFYNGVIACDKALTRDCVDCYLRLRGKNIINTLKSYVIYFATKNNRQRLRRSVSKFIAVSSFVKRVHLDRLDLNDNNIVTIPVFSAYDINGARNPFGKIETTVNLPADFILFVGRLVEEKGIGTLINAYGNLNTTTKLVLIGAGHLSDKYKGAGNIIAIENASDELLTEAYRRCCFTVFPSIWPEPMATVSFEAMSHKKAIIASRTGGFTDIVVDGETGLLIPPNDSEALAQAIRYLLANQKVAVSMGEMGYDRWRKNFSAEIVVPEIEHLYRNLLKRGEG